MQTAPNSAIFVPAVSEPAGRGNLRNTGMLILQRSAIIHPSTADVSDDNHIARDIASFECRTAWHAAARAVGLLAR